MKTKPANQPAIGHTAAAVVPGAYGYGDEEDGAAVT